MSLNKTMDMWIPLSFLAPVLTESIRESWTKGVYK